MSEHEFQLARLQAQERDNHQCVVCKSTKGLHTHHVKKTYGLGLDKIKKY
jgi:5-methylcytosine-specific restriction endonuclease McrA